MNLNTGQEAQLIYPRGAEPKITIMIKTSGSESRGQEEAVCTRISGLLDHYSELFARTVGVNF